MTNDIETRLIHAGEPEPRIRGAVSMPIFQSSTFVTEGQTGYYDVRYIRLNNTPNHEVLHAKLASLEGGEAAIVASSGMAIISTVFLTLLRAGDHLLVQRSLYGGTFDFVNHELSRFGIEFDFVDGGDPSSWEASLRPNSKAIYLESISNPLMRDLDLGRAAEFARAHGLVSVVDNTFASPVNCRPLEHGFDLVLHSGTKYLNGHNDIVCGAAIGSRELIDAIRIKMAYYGGALDPHACFLLHRGLKTLALRVRQQNASAAALAHALDRHPLVERVHYPGLARGQARERARSWFAGFGGMLSFEIRGGRAAAARLVETLAIPLYAPSLGGVETLVTFPSMTSHAGMSAEERDDAGISEGLVRVSVGIESAADLIRDFCEALDRIEEGGLDIARPVVGAPDSS